MDMSKLEELKDMSIAQFIMLILTKDIQDPDDLMHRAITSQKDLPDLVKLFEIAAREKEDVNAVDFMSCSPLDGRIVTFVPPIEDYYVPGYVQTPMKTGNADQLMTRGYLMNTSYEHTFRTLLWIEESQEKVEFRRFSRYGITPVAHGDSLFRLDVPNLAEERPSPTRGDRICLKRRSELMYKGQVVQVRQRDVLFRLTEGTADSDLCSKQFDAYFFTSRINHRRCHQAISQFSADRSLLLESKLFPRLDLPFRRFKMSREPLKYFDQRLDDCQRRAVENIVSHDERPTPYLIVGGIGTGKTTTICEAILQVYTLKRDAKILVCGNSNSSADLWARKLSISGVIHRSDLARLTSFYHLKRLVGTDIEDLALYNGNITEAMLDQYRIIVSNPYQPGFIHSLKFDYVFVDSANYVSEPKIMVTLTKAKPRGTIVLSGDTKQLGPTCYSTIADIKGLGLSLFERLTRMVIYKRQKSLNMGYNDGCITNLSTNYRSDPRVVAVNSEVFYHRELKFVVKTPEKYMRALGVAKPVVFHNVNGQDRQDEESPSCYNIAEAIVCICYAIKLYDAGLEPGQLGILMPFKLQVDKLRLLFEIFKREPCKIGTLNDFMDDEREVMIISTVRARLELREIDVQTHLELTLSPKRFNVATSRARWMNITVGCEQTLRCDQSWDDYIARAHRVSSHDSLFGASRSGDETETSYSDCSSSSKV